MSTGISQATLSRSDAHRVEATKSERFEISEEARSEGLGRINAAHTALQKAFEEMALARFQLSGMGADPARALTISVTQCETTMLWLEMAAKQVLR